MVEIVVQVSNRADSGSDCDSDANDARSSTGLRERRERRESREKTKPAWLMELTDMNARVGPYEDKWRELSGLRELPALTE